MSLTLAWALERARAQTLALATDLPAEALGSVAPQGTRHPDWVLGHLLLADTYLLYLLGVAPLPADFQHLLAHFGPASDRDGSPRPGSTANLSIRLREAGDVRVGHVSRMTSEDLSTPIPDEFLARAQPTLGHHLQSLVFHEGYHAGQLSSWRSASRLPPVGWRLGPG